MHGSDGRTGGQALMKRSGGRADGAERPRTVGRTGAERVQIVEQTGGQGPRGADMQTRGRAEEARTGPRRRGRADKRSGGRADGAVGANGWTGGLGGRADWGGRAY